MAGHMASHTAGHMTAIWRPYGRPYGRPASTLTQSLHKAPKARTKPLHKARAPFCSMHHRSLFSFFLKLFLHNFHIFFIFTAFSSSLKPTRGEKKMISFSHHFFRKPFSQVRWAIEGQGPAQGHAIFEMQGRPGGGREKMV